MRNLTMRYPRLPMLGLTVLAACAAASGAAGGALAMDACRGGEFSASPLRPLPQPAVIGVTVTDNSAENVGLAAAFTNGMRDAGARVPGTSTATVAMRLSWQVLSPGGSGNNQSSGGGASSLPQGGITRAPPQIPTQGVISGRGSLQPGVLVFRAEARDPNGATIYWIGSVQCTLQGSGNEALLYQLGQLIGGAVGQRRERVAL